MLIAIITTIISIAFLYYIYTKEETIFISEDEVIENNTVQTIEENNEKKEKEESEKIVVHISGAVNKEGVFELEENSRISDAINKAEGLKDNADTKHINLAFKLEDGMKIYIPTIEENLNKNVQNEEENVDETSKYVTTSSGVTDVQETRVEESGEKIEKVNINTASQTELETLPGIGPSTSLKIVNYREENGDFDSIEEIKEVSGIGDVKYENIKDLICVE